MAAGGLLYLFGIPAVCVGWQKNIHHLKRWAETVAANERIGSTAKFDIHSPRNQSLSNAVLLLGETIRGELPRRRIRGGDSPRARRYGHRGVVAVNVAAVGMLAVLALATCRRDDPGDLAAVFGMACCATLMVSPLSWGHYYMMMLPAVLFVPLRLARAGWVSLAMVVAAVPVLLTWGHYVFLRWTGRLGLLGLGTAAWFAAACGALALTEIGFRATVAGSPFPHVFRSRFDLPHALERMLPGRSRSRTLPETGRVRMWRNSRGR